MSLKIHGMAMEFPELFCCVAQREPCNLTEVKTCLCMFKYAPVMISAHEQQVWVVTKISWVSLLWMLYSYFMDAMSVQYYSL
jgi:hypothetical protein